MVNNKVVLPKEVAKAVEYYREELAVRNTAIMARVFRDDRWNDEDALALRNYVNEGPDNFDTLMQALVNGYIVEKSPEEELREYYGIARNNANFGNDYAQMRKEAIETTLSKLGITVEGINDNNTKGCE